MRILFVVGVCLVTAIAGYGQGDWHRMNESELRAVVPEKAPVIRENIETEFRTAAGISDGKRNVFGVVIITVDKALCCSSEESYLVYSLLSNCLQWEGWPRSLMKSPKWECVSFYLIYR